MADSRLQNTESLLPRRRFLSTGGALGLSLPGLLTAEAAAAIRGAIAGPAKIKACIIVFYYGGPSHLDTYDLKPEAPADIRGEFAPISTSVPGLHICEHLPHMAKVMHKVCLIRSMHHTNRLHDSASTEALTGRQSPQGDREEFAPIPQFFPCHAATIAHLRRDPSIEVPHVALPWAFRNVIEVPCQAGGFLGPSYAPLQIDVNVEAQAYTAGALSAPPGRSTSPLEARRQLLSRLDDQRLNPVSTADSTAWMLAYEKACRLLEAVELRQAIDLSREDVRTRDRYGYGPAPLTVGEGGGGGNGAELGFARQMRGQNLLLARRLVEAGVPFVNVYDFRQQGQNWDAHFKCFNQHKTHLLPLADRSLAALIEDLDQRGLLDSTLVVAMGEFGRTPRINGDGGRDHWPDCYSLLLAGGGVKGGLVHGSSDALGEYPATDPVSPADLAATIYSRFGLDPQTEIHDQTGRPWRIADGKPLTSLFRDA